MHNKKNVWPWKWRSRSRSTAFTKCHSIANINHRKSYVMHFCERSHRFWEMNVLICDLEYVRQSHGGEEQDLCLSIANINIHKIHNRHFCVMFNRFRDISILNIWPWLFRSKWQSRKTELMPFDGEYIVIGHFALALNVCEILICLTFGIEI